MDKIQAYRRVLQILSETPDYKDIVFRIASANPEVLVELFDGSILNQVAKIYVHSGKIPAIREYRAAMNSTLKEAMDAVEALAVSQGLEQPK